nr:zinc finger MYM-type protein 1-like [Malus domestica]
MTVVAGVRGKVEGGRVSILLFLKRRSHNGVNGIARPLGSHGNNLRGPLELLNYYGTVFKRKSSSGSGSSNNVDSSNTVDNDDKVREVVMENALRNLKLLASSIKKEIVNSCALETLDAIMDGIKDRFFSILVDEARDVSVKEQMAMVLRYVDDNEHVIERFVGIQHVTDTTSSSLKDAIDTFFSRNGLSISKLQGQGYDGASNMRALVAVAKKNIDIASFFATANSVVNHVGASCKRRDLLRQQLQEELVIAFENDCLITGRGLNQETSLKRADNTQWNSYYGTLISIISMFSSVVHVLQMVIDDNPNESAGEANKLMREIRRSRRNAPIKTNHHHYRVELFIYVIDEQITELEDRFNELQLLQWREYFVS